MTKRKPWAYLAIGGVLAIGLSSAAFAADLTDSNADSTNPAALASDKASSVATAVLDALTGGSNPSTVAANANASSEHGNSTNANNVDQVTTEEGAHTTAFDSRRGRLYVFLPKRCEAAVYQEVA